MKGNHFITLYIFLHAANRDFNTSEIVIDFEVGDTRKTGSFQIFDDEINEAREEFAVSLKVLGDIIPLYIIQNTTCRIPENDRKQSFYVFDVPDKHPNYIFN